MAIPEAVQKQADAADAAMKAKANPQQDTAQAAQGQAEVARVEVAPPVPTPTVADDKAEQRYKTLQGKYNADTATLRGQVAELTSQVDVLAEQLEQAKQQGSGEPLDVRTYLTEEQVEMLGEDQIAVLGTVVSKAAAEAVAKAIEPVKSQINSLGQVRAQDQRSAFYAELARQVPDWQIQNGDDGFMVWLNELEGLSGLSRKDNLTYAFEKLDANSVARYFTAYKESLGTRDTPMPLTGGSAPPATQGEVGQKIKRSDITRFYEDVKRGRYTPEEVAQHERELSVARAEGRIVQG